MSERVSEYTEAERKAFSEVEAKHRGLQGPLSELATSIEDNFGTFTRGLDSEGTLEELREGIVSRMADMSLRQTVEFYELAMSERPERRPSINHEPEPNLIPVGGGVYRKPMIDGDRFVFVV